jgi:4-hydroxy-2-oxoheptanedioate aldolase
MAHILATCKKHKVAPGLHTSSPEEANMRIAEGWQFIAIVSELKMMLDGAAAVLSGLGGGRMNAELAKY